MPVVQAAQLLAHQLAEGGIERAQRLVHQEGLGAADDGAAQGHALAVAAGEAATGRSSRWSMRRSFAVSSTRWRISARGTPWAKAGSRCSGARSCAGRGRTAGKRRRCRARAARRKVTSSPSRRISPEVGSSSPAIMRSVVVLPQPEGPSSTKKLAVLDGQRAVLDRDEVAKGLVQVVSRIWAMALSPGSG